jgi:transcriptional regulator with XRE-family HTH domain
MRTPRRTTIIVVGGALAVASAGYGLGSQADDGTAVARSEQSTDTKSRIGGPPPFAGRAQPPGFQDLADTLGVDADELAQALRDFHESEEGDRRDELASALAKALDIPADKVTAAFEQMHERREARFAARLAKALDVDADEVKAALDKLSDETPRRPDELAQALADELGVDVTDVRRALFEARPDRGRGRPHRHPAMPLRQLASALDVSRTELRKAFREVRSGAENGWEQRNQELAQFLANRLNVDVAKVSDALRELPRPVPPGHGGRPGPGGPEAFGRRP